MLTCPESRHAVQVPETGPPTLGDGFRFDYTSLSMAVPFMKSKIQISGVPLNDAWLDFASQAAGPR